MSNWWTSSEIDSDNAYAMIGGDYNIPTVNYVTKKKVFLNPAIPSYNRLSFIPIRQF
jgi:hypothetical protein